jgi:hypothetical protein
VRARATRLRLQGRKAACISRAIVGAWLSLVEHLVRDEGVVGSNPIAPTSTSQGTDPSDVPVNAAFLPLRLAHKPVRRRAVRRVRLLQDSNGNYSARKRLPEDVRALYKERYRAGFEAKFTRSHLLNRHVISLGSGKFGSRQTPTTQSAPTAADAIPR